MKPDRLLLDTHILLWALYEPDRVDRHIYEDIYDYNVPVHVSVETLREVVILRHLGKIDSKIDLKRLLIDLDRGGIRILEIKRKHVEALEKLSHPVINGKTHDDPFDRMLMAQAISERLTLVSSDMKFPYYRDLNFDLMRN
ncbi:MAG: type II toxin-antitoxin system VapC family toxin [Tannerella sp.]|jgi:PIN domain nuclease of toxin-antitoxin system|nr:type II toxin-antitoxin system VapC family toxin [Tannerella sp.]